MGGDERKQRYKTRSRSRERDESRLKPKKSHKRSSGSESDSDDSYNKSKKSRHHRSYSPSPDRFGKSAPKKKRRSESSDSGSNSDSSPDIHKSKSKKKKHRRSRSRSKEKKHKHKKKTHSDSPQRSLTSEELMRLKEKRKVEKEQQKLLETAEEKRARRLAKKEAKEKKMKMKMGWDDEYMEYTNGDNPFGDEHLLDTFVWGKKLEKEGKHNLAQIELETLQKKKMIENKIELEKVKKRRMEREREMEEREREREAEQRDKEAEYYREWEKQEDHFHLNQAKLRSKIRILDGRAKPIDLLAKYISAEDDDLAIEMHEPYTYLNGLTITDLEDLLEDIKVYVELEAAKNIDYWRDITVITEDELGKLRKIDPNSKDYLGERRSGINSSVEGEVHATFKGKTLEQLNMLEKHIRAKLTSGESVDVGYWESLLQQLRAHVARTRLRERHQDQLRRKLFKLKEEQGIESAPLFPIVKDEGTPDASAGTNTLSSNMGPPPNPQPRPASPKPGTSGTSTQAAVQSAGGEGDESDGEEEEDNDESILKEEDLTQQPYDDYDAGSYSPKLLRPSELEPDTIVYDPEDDIKRLEYARQRLIRIGQAKEETDREFEKRAREGMTDDEATFSVEVPLEKQTLLWSDKYRPRKPRFFNRVHTGFEWNKYNQTHYDIDNPPPKIVQGYKFNIFYPDLIDKTKTPEYTLTPCEDNRDFAVLKFHAGPPYEDIAFKIVNREWEYSYKRGFRCQFHNNIFQLWYHFKRYRYRR